MSEEKTIIDLAKKHLSEEKTQKSQETTEPESIQRPSMRRQESEKENHIKDALNDLLAKVETKKDYIPIKLPSMGVFNEGIDTVEIRPFTYEDERILRSVTKMNEGIVAISTLMRRCVKGIEYSNLSLFDKNYLLFKLREISYGDDYEISVTCQECQEKNDLSVKISKLRVDYADPNMEYPKKVYLPDSEVDVYVRCPRAEDEKLLGNSASLTDSLWKFVDRIKDYEERGIIQEFLSKTTAKDITTLRQAIFSDNIGLNYDVRFKCSNCNSDERTTLPMNESFFSVS